MTNKKQSVLSIYDQCLTLLSYVDLISKGDPIKTVHQLRLITEQVVSQNNFDGLMMVFNEICNWIDGFDTELPSEVNRIIQIKKDINLKKVYKAIHRGTLKGENDYRLVVDFIESQMGNSLLKQELIACESMVLDFEQKIKG